MSDLTTLPADFGPLREAAIAFAKRMVDEAPSSLMTINPAVFAQGMVHIWMVLLADLSKPGPRDFWARWLAEKVGLTVGATAPGWTRVQTYVDHEPATYWALSVPGERAYNLSIAFFHEPGDDDDGATVWRVVPGISTITNPDAALRLAILAVSK